MPLGLEPDDLLWTLEVGTGLGEEHELRLEKHLRTCQSLSRAPEESKSIRRASRRYASLSEKPRFAESAEAGLGRSVRQSGLAAGPRMRRRLAGTGVDGPGRGSGP